MRSIGLGKWWEGETSSIKRGRKKKKRKKRKEKREKRKSPAWLCLLVSSPLSLAHSIPPCERHWLHRSAGFCSLNPIPPVYICIFVSDETEKSRSEDPTPGKKGREKGKASSFSRFPNMSSSPVFCRPPPYWTLRILAVSYLLFLLWQYYSHTSSPSSSSSAPSSSFPDHDSIEALRNRTSFAGDRSVVNRRALQDCFDPKIQITVTPNASLADEQYVTVLITEVPKPSDDMWVGMFSPPSSR